MVTLSLLCSQRMIFELFLPFILNIRITYSDKYLNVILSIWITYKDIFLMVLALNGRHCDNINDILLYKNYEPKKFNVSL